ncbi:AAA family ATPase [Methylolobus aquaticus]
MTKPNTLADWRAPALLLEEHLNQVILGQPQAIRLLLIAVFARGHALLEGNVGIGKTTLLRAMARGLGGECGRIEGTVDLMPTDLVYHTYLDASGKPGVDPGPLLHHGEQLSTFFFNEINRARPQVHSLLLRVMAEKSVSAFNREFYFPHLLVFADRNRVEKEETFELPAAARDRFTMEIALDYPRDTGDLQAVMFEPRFHDTSELIRAIPEGLIDFKRLNSLAAEVQESIHASERLRLYAVDLWRATHHPGDFGIQLHDAEGIGAIQAGASPRGMSLLVRAARVHAWLQAREAVLPEDVQAVFHPVIAHRLVLDPVYEFHRSELVPELICKILNAVAAP